MQQQISTRMLFSFVKKKEIIALKMRVGQEKYKILKKIKLKENLIAIYCCDVTMISQFVEYTVLAYTYNSIISKTLLLEICLYLVMQSTGKLNWFCYLDKKKRVLANSRSIANRDCMFCGLG